jgi:peptidoglycan/LPS O-acetylase OafA/YrhL
LGNLSYRIYKRIENVNMSKGVLAGMTGFVWLYTILYGKLEIPNKELIYFIVFFLAVPVIFKFSRRSRIDYAIGELSYPIYISHMFVVLFLGRMTILVKVLGPGLTVALVAAGMAMILNRVIARPIEKIRQARVHKSPKPVLAA